MTVALCTGCGASGGLRRKDGADVESAAEAVVEVGAEQHGAGGTRLDSADSASSSGAAHHQRPAAAAARRLVATSSPVPASAARQTRRRAARVVRVAALGHRTQAQRPQGSPACCVVHFYYCAPSNKDTEIMQGTMPGARRRGRPRTAWMDNIKTWTGLSVEESVRMTEDRDKWRKCVWPTLGSRTAKEQEHTYVVPDVVVHPVSSQN